MTDKPRQETQSEVKDPGILRNWRSILLYALLPAIITSIAPIIYSELKRTRFELSYTVTASPPVKSTDGLTSIYAIEAYNRGSSTLHGVSIKIELQSGKIIGDSSEQIGIAQSIKRSEQQFNQIEETLHPKESLKVALLIDAANENEPRLTVRSEEVVGVPRLLAEQSDNGTRSKPLVFLLFATTYISAIAAVFLFRRRVGLSVMTPYKTNIILFVAAICGIPRLQDRLWDNVIKGIEYFGAADIIVAEGIQQPIGKRLCYIVAIECLVLAGAEQGKNSVSLYENLKALDNNYSRGDFEALCAEAPASPTLQEMRQALANYVSVKCESGERLKYPTPPRSRTRRVRR